MEDYTVSKVDGVEETYEIVTPKIEKDIITGADVTVVGMKVRMTLKEMQSKQAYHQKQVDMYKSIISESGKV